MAGQAVTPSPTGIRNYTVQEQEGWIQFVQTGGLLSDVPPDHRRDKVCFYATMACTGPSAVERWSTTILPYIPLDVLHMGFITGNIGHKIQADNEEAERQQAARLVVAHQERLQRRA